MARAGERVSAESIQFGADGLIPAVCQHHETGEVLMLAFMNDEALRKTLETGDAWFWSRSRAELWHKGATSGNFLRVRSIAINCEENSVLLRVQPEGPTCHTGAYSCYYRDLDWERAD